MIDPKKLRDMDYQSDGPEMQRVWDMMFCPDPLTLDAAVQVMGREPDEMRNQPGWDGWYWDRGDVIVASLHGEVGCDVHGTTIDDPTIGQFAMLVAVAGMGVKA